MTLLAEEVRFNAQIGIFGGLGAYLLEGTVADRNLAFVERQVLAGPRIGIETGEQEIAEADGLHPEVVGDPRVGDGAQPDEETVVVKQGRNDHGEIVELRSFNLRHHSDEVVGSRPILGFVVIAELDLVQTGVWFGTALGKIGPAVDQR